MGRVTIILLIMLKIKCIKAKNSSKISQAINPKINKVPLIIAVQAKNIIRIGITSYLRKMMMMTSLRMQDQIITNR